MAGGLAVTPQKRPAPPRGVGNRNAQRHDWDTILDGNPRTLTGEVLGGLKPVDYARAVRRAAAVRNIRAVVNYATHGRPEAGSVYVRAILATDDEDEE